MDLWWLAPRLALAGMIDGLLPNLLVAGITGGCAIATVLWLAKKRWEPALQHLTSVVDREMQGAERAAQALQQRAQAQAQRGHRQAASVHGAIAGVRALQNLTEELDQCATDLNQLAQLMAHETHRPASPGIARHVVSSAKQLAMTAEQARITYRRLQSSVSQLLAESTNDEAMGEEMAQHAHELTGAVQRLRQDVHGAKPANRRPRDPRNAAPLTRRDEPPRRDPRDDLPPPRRDESSSRRDPRDERPHPAPTPRDERRYEDNHPADLARERSRNREGDHAREAYDESFPRDERRERGAPPHRDEPPPRRRESVRPLDESEADIAAAPSQGRGGNAGPTRRRDHPPDVMPRREAHSGWLSDHYSMPPRRHEDDSSRRRY